jgi:hypothetical protein
MCGLLHLYEKLSVTSCYLPLQAKGTSGGGGSQVVEKE